MQVSRGQNVEAVVYAGETSIQQVPEAEGEGRTPVKLGEKTQRAQL